MGYPHRTAPGRRHCLHRPALPRNPALGSVRSHRRGHVARTIRSARSRGCHVPSAPPGPSLRNRERSERADSRGVVSELSEAEEQGHGRTFPPDRRERMLRPFRRVPCAGSLRGYPLGCSRPEHHSRTSTGRSSGSRLVRSQVAFPPRGSGHVHLGPGRIQRRPRAGFAPASLFSPAPDGPGAPIEINY